MEGKGVFYWVDGEKYQGSFKNNLKDGAGTFTGADGEVMKKRYTMGKEIK